LPARLKDFEIKTGHFVKQARLVGSQVQLTLDDGSVSSADHVLLGTGYSVDISRYAFLTPGLIERVQLMDGYPALQSGFRSSLPGLHFLGATAARSFGPLLYFVAGAEFASSALCAEILKNKAVPR
jgi:hypothetical protein